MIDGIVKTLVGDESDRHRGVIEIGMAENGVEAHRAATAPTPDADARGIEIGSGAEDFSCGGGLIARGEIWR